MDIPLKFEIIEASGSPYEIGFIHGSRGKREVLNSINTYKAMFRDYSNLDWAEAKRRSRSYIDAINKFDQDLMEEIRGIAEGAGVDLEDILALNARSEVIMMSSNTAPVDGCTAIFITPEYTKTGHTLLAQNWDWKGTQIDSLLLLKIAQPNKPVITMVTEGGIIGKIGFNSAGLGVCLNALGTKGNPAGLPLHIILRGILGCEKLSDAIGKINLMPNACAANYMIAHKSGEALDIEKAPDDFDVMYAEDGIFVHSNHFISPRLYHVDDTTRIMAPDTYLRRARANKLLHLSKDNIGPELIKDILRDHVDYPDSICRHDDPLDDPGHAMCTVFSIIMDLTSGEFDVIKGNPCAGEYQHFK